MNTFTPSSLRAPGWLSLSLWIAVSRENRPSLKGGGLCQPLRHTPREAGAGAKEFIWSFADVFISMYANKINLIFKNWLFHKVEKASSSNVVQLFVSEKATTPGRDGKGLLWIISTDAGVAGTVWNTHTYFTFLLFFFLSFSFSIKSISFGSELCWIDQFHVNSLKYFSISSSFFIFKDMWT